MMLGFRRPQCAEEESIFVVESLVVESEVAVPGPCRDG